MYTTALTLDEIDFFFIKAIFCSSYYKVNRIDLFCFATLLRQRVMAMGENVSLFEGTLMGLGNPPGNKWRLRILPGIFFGNFWSCFIHILVILIIHLPKSSILILSP